MAEADRLLSEVVPPAGSTIRAGSPPPALAGPIMGAPASSHLVDDSRVWSVPMSMTGSLSWLRAHPLPGLTPDGVSSGSGADGESGGYSWSDKPTPAYENPELEVGVTPDGSDRSIVRADGVDVWLSAAPLIASARGPRVHVTIVGACPTSIAGYVDVYNTGADLASTMLPAAIATAGLICRYNPADNSSHPSMLAHATVLTPAAAQSLARAANAIWTGSPGSGSTSCPADNGLTDVIVFGYAGQADVDLWYHASGCQGITNGYVSADEDANPPFYDDFQPLAASLTR